MARLGGMSSETLSSARGRLSAASIGLGSILREQKAMPVANRMNVLLGLSSQTSPTASRTLLSSPVHSLASSPVESSGFLDVDDAEQKDEDMWGMDMCESRSMHHLDTLQQRRLRPDAHDGLGSAHTYSSALAHCSYGAGQRLYASSRMHLNAMKQHISTVTDKTQSAQYLVVDKSPGLPESIPMNSGGPVRFSPLSKVPDSQLHFSHVHQNATPSRSIPQAEKPPLYDSSLQVEPQSAPVNVPNWAKILKKDPTAARAININSIEEACEEEEQPEWLPPHEILAREHSLTQRMTSSMCEGQGRTLKGRDMRRVRNAVWRQTGFAD